ncbi:hypothetical protein [Streptomyces sp. NPDC097610]|uniref:hypothetical protein n=1 Tax=Streptomyces sp. NPDC097610 TaxID=3157227 RepID=UPI003326269A
MFDLVLMPNSIPVSGLRRSEVGTLVGVSNGTTRTVLTASDGLASPPATAVCGNRPYVTDGGLYEPHDAQLQSGKSDLGALLSP